MFLINQKSKPWLIAAAMSGVIGVTGCSVKPDVVSQADRQNRINADLSNLFAGQDPVTGPISLAEAVARAMKYNLDSRVKQMELAVAVRDLDFSNRQLLPDLVAEAGYSNRDNDPGAVSVDAETGEVSLPASRSQERSTETNSIELSWDVLDFGISYYTAKQKGYDVAVAEERKRKTTQNIIQDVIDAYWKAWSAQQIGDQLGELIARTESTIDASRRNVSSQTQNKLEALEYQRGLLQTRSSLLEMKERLGLAKTRLAALINLRPDSNYSLAGPNNLGAPDQLSRDFNMLVEEALLNRPELREEDYRLRISQLDVKKAMLSMFPSLTFRAGTNYDGNRFLINNDWNTSGVSISWNILALFGINAERKFREAQVELANARRLALSMAVMTQVRLSTSRYELAQQRHEAAAELADVSSEYADVILGSDRESNFSKIQAEAQALAAQLRENLAYTEVQAAYARVLNSVGVDPVPNQVSSHSVSDLSQEFASYWQVVNGRYLALN